MWRCPGQSLEYAKEMIGAQPRNLCEAAEIVRGVRIMVNHPCHSRNTRQSARLAGGGTRRRYAARNLYRLCRYLNAKFFGIYAGLTALKGYCSCDQRSYRTDGRQARHIEMRLVRACFAGDSFKQLRIIAKRNTAIASAVLMSATEGIAPIPKQQRAGCHEFTPCRRTVLKSAAHHDGDRCPRMLFFERLVHWAGIANDIGHRPTITGGKPQ